MVVVSTVVVRVLHLVVAGDIGGAERLLIDLVRHQRHSNAVHRVALLTPNPHLQTYFTDAGLDVLPHLLVRETPWAFLTHSAGPREVRWLEAEILAFRAQVLHTHTLGSHVLGIRAAKRAGIPTLRTEHHFAYYTDITAAPFSRWALRRTERVIAISQFVEQRVLAMFPWAAPRMRRIRNGVDIEHFAFHEATEHSGPARFLSACRLERWKGVHYIISALAQVPGARLTIAGEGSQRSSLQAQVRSLSLGDRVTFVGHDSDVRARFQEADFSINSSAEEPLGLSVLESLSVGRPVVAFRQGGLPEILEDGVTGFFATERTVLSLTGAMMRAVEARAHPTVAKQMAADARSFASQHCDVRTMCNAYGTVYAELAG
jgi:L-malate glycosyltransferase